MEYTPEVIQALLDGPAATPPTGTTSDFNAERPFDAQGITIVAISLFLVTMAGYLRAYSRVRVMKTVFLEDCNGLYPSLSGFICALADHSWF